MEPSWTSPIPQAMQQHRGSQQHKPTPARPVETVRVPTNAVRPEGSGHSEVAAPGGSENSG
jgi:hypothetical protein